MPHQLHKFLKNQYVFYFTMFILGLSALDSAFGLLFFHNILQNGFRLLLDVFLLKVYYDFFYHHR